MSDSEPKQAPFGEMPNEVYAVYRDERQRLTESEKDYARCYDRMITTLSGGAIALSLAFLKDIVGDKPIVGAALLVFAWILLGLAIGMNVFSIYITPLAFAEHRDILDKEAQKGGREYWTRVRAEQKKKGKPKVIHWLNVLSLVAFLVGLLLLLWFTYGSVSAREIANG